MRIQALKNFSGAVTMTVGEERELDNEELLKDLLRAGYIKESAAGIRKEGKKSEGKRGRPKIPD